MRELYMAARGTLAPWAPQHLVNTGPYRFSRNPIPVGLILGGWWLL